MIFLGIDPGLDGGIAVIKSNKIELFKTPVIGGKEYDVQEMKILLRDATAFPSYATIENQIAMPGQGLTSTLQTGKGFGIWLGLLAGLEVPHQIVSAPQWQRKLFFGMRANLDTKDKSEVIAKRLFPSADFRRSERARVANDGLTDAACIAHYGRISMGHQEPSTEAQHKPLESAPEICGTCGTFIPGTTTPCLS